MKFFGPNWGAKEIERAPAPVGTACYWCHEPILDGDRGTILPALFANGEGEVTYHRGCFLFQIFCRDGDLDGRSKRDAGRWVEGRVDGGTADG